MANKIKWSEKDAQQLKKTVLKFNQKVKAVNKKYPYIAKYQPIKINYDDLEHLVRQGTRKDYQSLIRRYEAYLQQGAELPYTTKEGVNITIWERDNIDKIFKEINKKRQREIEEYQPSTYKGTMGTIERNNLRPRKNTIESVKAKDFQRFKESLEKQLIMFDNKHEKYKTNFLKGIENVFGEDSELYDLISRMKADDAVKLYYNNPLLQLDFIYDPQDAEIIENTMIEQINEEVKAGNIILFPTRQTYENEIIA